MWLALWAFEVIKYDNMPTVSCRLVVACRRSKLVRLTVKKLTTALNSNMPTSMATMSSTRVKPDTPFWLESSVSGLISLCWQCEVIFHMPVGAAFKPWFMPGDCDDEAVCSPRDAAGFDTR